MTTPIDAECRLENIAGGKVIKRAVHYRRFVADKLRTNGMLSEVKSPLLLLRRVDGSAKLRAGWPQEGSTEVGRVSDLLAQHRIATNFSPGTDGGGPSFEIINATAVSRSGLSLIYSIR